RDERNEQYRRPSDRRIVAFRPMKKLLDRILPWGITIAKLRKQIVALEQVSDQQRVEIQAILQVYRELRETHETQIKGTNVLLEFIHRTHRLSVPAANGSIRAALQSKL